MNVSRSTLLRLSFVCVLLVAGLFVSQAAVAQPTKPECDLDAVIKHQEEHAQELANFAEEAKDDLDAALATLYRTAIAYQALAVECGFADSDAVEAAHELEHSDLIHTEDHHDEDEHHSEDEEAEELALALSIGDPENGKLLFNTVQTEVSFACATCHRVDSTETLIGPGLLGISGHSHEHDESEGNSTPDASMSGMVMGEATAEATSEPDQTFEEKVEFLRTSIINPSAFVMTGFPDNLMPKVYGQIFTEQEINDLIAYLFTLD
jgi:cytochrome c2